MTQSHDQEPEPGQPHGEQPEPAGQPGGEPSPVPPAQPAAEQPQVSAPAVPGFQVQPTQAYTQQPAGYVYEVQPTHSYDQQPAGQPYPGAYGYPAPLPPAPMAYGPVRRPGVVTASAVLAYVQAGITGVATLLMFVSLFDSEFGPGRLLIQTVVVLAAAVGVGLLIAGGVRLMAGTDRTMLTAACVLEFVICLFYLIFFAAMPDSVLDPDNSVARDGAVGAARGVLVVFAIFFAVMPTISLAMSRGQAATDFLRSRGVR